MFGGGAYALDLALCRDDGDPCALGLGLCRLCTAQACSCLLMPAARRLTNQVQCLTGGHQRPRRTPRRPTSRPPCPTTSTCAPTPRAHNLHTRTALGKSSSPSLRAPCNLVCLVHRFLEFEGPVSGQNPYVVNNYTATQPQGVRHQLLPQKTVPSFTPGSLEPISLRGLVSPIWPESRAAAGSWGAFSSHSFSYMGASLPCRSTWASRAPAPTGVRLRWPACLAAACQ